MPALLLLLLLAGSLALAAPAPVPLTVRNHTGQALQAAPVRGGVPFARGVWQDRDVARLTDAAGKVLPCEARPIAHWYDGSVKWLLVDTQVDLSADGTAALNLTTGTKSAAARKVTITTQADSLTVDTGPAKFLFSKRAFGVPAAAWADLSGDGKWDAKVVSAPGEFACEVEHNKPGEPQEENWLRDAAGGSREKFTATPTGDYQCIVESANDLHAVVKLSGWLVNAEGRRLLQYVIRAHAYAGQPALKLQATFVYAGKPKEDFIRSLVLSFPRESQGPTRWSLGGEASHSGALAARDAEVSLTTIGPEKVYHLAPYDQDKTVTYTVTQGEKQLASGKEAAGWARLGDARGSLQLAVRDFWQMHPKELRLRPEAALVYLWPEQGGKVLDLRRRYDEVENTYHYDLSLWPYGGEGVGLTHEIMLRYGKPEADSAAGMAAALNRPLLLECAPQYLADTRVFGAFLPSDRARFPHLEAVQDVRVAWIQRNQAQFHWDGMVDYGDTLFHGYNTPSHYGYIQPKGWCSRGYAGWLNDDGGLTNGLFMQALRSGDYETFLTAARMARHSMDVDTCHYCAAEPRFVGGGHRHDQQHWGNGTRGYGTATHGIIDLYLLTGDERALDVARETAGYHLDPFEGEDEDMIGGLIRFWEITGDTKYREAAAKWLEAELGRPASPKWMFATTGHFRMVLNTSTNFMYYLNAVPDAEAVRLREAIIKTIEANSDTYMSAWEDAGSYLPLLLGALAYDLSGDQRHLAVLAALMQRNNLPFAEPVPPDFLVSLRALPFEQLPALANGKWGVNNVYSLQLAGFNAMPYVLAAFARGGLDEVGFRQVARINNPAPPFEEVLDPKQIGAPWKLQGKDSFLYSYTLQHSAPDDRVGRSKLLLYEDGQLLGPAHNGHIDTMQNGGGRWSHWGSRSIQFSTSDNSDPRTNGRQYKVVNPGP